MHSTVQIRLTASAEERRTETHRTAFLAFARGRGEGDIQSFEELGQVRFGQWFPKRPWWV